MIILKRTKSFSHLALESLFRRLKTNDPTKYKNYRDEYIKLNVGYEGELQADREWDELEIPVNYSLLHNYETLSDIGRSHQMDTVFLCQHFIWIIDIKNFSGILMFDEDKSQFLRKDFEGDINGYYNPVDQIERHARFINRLFKKWGINLPVEVAVIIVKDSTIIQNAPKFVPVFHLSGLQSKLNKLFQKHPNPYITDFQYNEIKKRLLVGLKRKIWRPSVDSRDIARGVLCRNCNYRTAMEFKHGTFICPLCNRKSKNAFLEAIYDYKYLFSNSFTNSEIREFLNIKSIYSTTRLLTRLNFETSGSYRNRKYKIPDEIRK
ncbi:nuclease-related domain-containing protein [Ureibacillus acetophenoni]|uniref:Nuclease-like protein n=1 Tax=Ureibacillus acetophenoni TaxID=614649 RepID=A0A285TYW9_9BACL|nr:nuclease-related domain-containing protein [Ureibacillus acetophenoni]SOC34762.1 nuclease-like protein [Ureibacillus acetophenoni]